MLPLWGEAAGSLAICCGGDHWPLPRPYWAGPYWAGPYWAGLFGKGEAEKRRQVLGGIMSLAR